MKKIFKKIMPAIILTFYAIIAGGSFEGFGISLILTIILMGVIMIILFFVAQAENNKTRKEGLEKAKDQFGTYTEHIEYEIGKYILYDEPKHRILLKDAIVDSSKLYELKTTEKKEQKGVKYKSEEVTKTNTGSMAGRAIIGSVVAGPVGALIGGATAKKKTEIKKTPEYYHIPAEYTIEVFDIKGTSRAKFTTVSKQTYIEVKTFLQRIIDNNNLEEKKAKQLEEENKLTKINAFDPLQLTLGSNIISIKDILANCTIKKNKDNNEMALAAEAVNVINNGWHATFEHINLVIKDETVNEIVGVSYSYSAGKFQILKSDLNNMITFINTLYGEPYEANDDINYDILTDDNNCINAYSWNSAEGQKIAIDVMCDKGKYKYRFVSKI